MGTITIFAGRVARDLINREYKLLDIKPDEKNKLKTVFYFEDTEDLRRYLQNEHNIFLKKKSA